MTTATATPYDWSTQAEPPGSFAPKVPPGKHKMQIVKVLHETKNGPLADSDGNPAMMVVFADSQGREAAQYITLVSDTDASWALRAIFQTCDPPANIAKMTAAGVTPEHFRNHDFAEKQLVGRRLLVEVSHNTAKNGKTYVNLAFLDPAKAHPTVDAAAAHQANADSIPF